MILWRYSQSTFTLGKLKNMPDLGGNRTYDLGNASPNVLPTELRGQVGSSM